MHWPEVVRGGCQVRAPPLSRFLSHIHVAQIKQVMNGWIRIFLHAGGLRGVCRPRKADDQHPCAGQEAWAVNSQRGQHQRQQQYCWGS